MELPGVRIPQPPPRPVQTQREREALIWLAAGKTSWEISVLFDISEGAVNKLIARALEKLGAVNRTQAVVNAVRLGEIEV